MCFIFFQEIDYLYCDNLECGIENLAELVGDRLDRICVIYRRCSFYLVEFGVQVVVVVVKLVLAVVEIVKK